LHFIAIFYHEYGFTYFMVSTFGSKERSST
jgi:hypothetical protein